MGRGGGEGRFLVVVTVEECDQGKLKVLWLGVRERREREGGELAGRGRFDGRGERDEERCTLGGFYKEHGRDFGVLGLTWGAPVLLHPDCCNSDVTPNLQHKCINDQSIPSR